jgi:uncharacterized protein involved in outer membrane biogenesis
MKVFRILLLVFIIVLLSVIIGGYYFLSHLDLNKFKPQITSRVQSALRRSFDYQDANLKVSLQDGLYVKFHGVSLGDNERFGTQPFILVKDIDLQMDILAIVLRKTLAVSHLNINSPTINLIKNNNGELNAQTLGVSSSPVTASGPKQNFSPAAQPTPQESKKMALPAIFIKDIVLQNGVIHFVDQSAPTPIDVSLSQTHLIVKDFSLNKPFQIEFQAAALSQDPNLSMDGQVELRLNDNGVKLKDFRISFNLNKIPLEQIKSFIPAGVTIPWPEKCVGKTSIILHSLELDPKGLKQIDADLSIKEGGLLVKNVSPGLDLDLPFINLSVNHFDFKNPFHIKADLGYLTTSPNVSFDGKVLYAFNTGDIEVTEGKLTTDLSHLPWDDLKTKLPIPTDVPWPNELKGLLSVSLKKVLVNSKGLQELLTDISLDQAAVTFAEIAPGISLNIPQLSAQVKDLSLGKEFGFEISAAYLSDVPNINLNGRLAFNPINQMIQIKNTHIDTNLDSVSLDKLRSSVKALEKASLPTEIKGQLHLTIEDMRASSKGVSEIALNSSFEKGRLVFKELNVPIDPIVFNLNWVNKNLNVENLKASVGAGDVKGALKVTAISQTPDYSGQLVARNLNAKEILNQNEFPVKVEGLLGATINFLGQGLNPDVLTKNLQMQSEFSVTEGKLININVLKMALSQMSMIPNLMDRIEANLPDKYKEILTQQDTNIEKITLRTTLEQEKVLIPSFILQGDSFLIEASGSLSLDQSYALTGSFIIPADLTEIFLKSVPELKYIIDQENQIRFPVTVRGKTTDFKVVPDFEYLTKRVAVNKGKEELKKVLNKYIGSEDNQETPQGQTQSQPQKESPEDKMIGNILNTIFK